MRRTTASSSCPAGERSPNPSPVPDRAPPPPSLADEMPMRSDARRWWKEAQDGAAIEAAGLPYAAAPAGPTSYGMRVLSIFVSDQAYTLRRADDLLHQQAPGASQGRSYALLAADLFTKARDW
jgi:ubiquitin carboxyl-terminal hydrolase 15